MNQLNQRLNLYFRLIRLHKPIGILLLLWPTLMAVWLASDGHPDWRIVAIFTVGTILMRSAGCAMNDYADRDFDKHVKRTVDRPLTAGKIKGWEAVMVASAGLDFFPADPAAERTHQAIVRRCLDRSRQLSLLQTLLCHSAGLSGHCIRFRHSNGICGSTGLSAPGRLADADWQYLLGSRL